MNPREQQLNLLRFLQNKNVVVIRDERDYERFRWVLASHGLEDLAAFDIEYRERRIMYAMSSSHPGWDGKALCAECRVGRDEIEIVPYDEKAAVKWYGIDPYSVDDIVDPGPGAEPSTHHHHTMRKEVSE